MGEAETFEIFGCALSKKNPIFSRVQVSVFPSVGPLAGLSVGSSVRHAFFYHGIQVIK